MPNTVSEWINLNCSWGSPSHVWAGWRRRFLSILHRYATIRRMSWYVIEIILFCANEKWAAPQKVTCNRAQAEQNSRETRSKQSVAHSSREQLSDRPEEASVRLRWVAGAIIGWMELRDDTTNNGTAIRSSSVYGSKQSQIRMNNRWSNNASNILSRQLSQATKYKFNKQSQSTNHRRKLALFFDIVHRFIWCAFDSIIANKKIAILHPTSDISRSWAKSIDVIFVSRVQVIRGKLDVKSLGFVLEKNESGVHQSDHDRSSFSPGVSKSIGWPGQNFIIQLSTDQFCFIGDEMEATNWRLHMVFTAWFLSTTNVCHLQVWGFRMCSLYSIRVLFIIFTS